MAATQDSEADKEVFDCPVDPDGDLEDPNNLFTCEVGQSCCTVDLEPACCKTKDISEEISDQVALWLPLLAIILALGIFIWWCRSDEACCDVEKPLLYRCGCKKRPEDEETSDSDDEDIEASRVSLRSQKSSTTMLVVDDGTAHDANDLELAADNLEAQLDEEEEGEEGLGESEKEEEEDKDKEEDDEEEAKKSDDDDDEKDEKDKEEDKDEDPEKGKDDDDDKA